MIENNVPPHLTISRRSFQTRKPDNLKRKNS